jgi:hypothetical protein
MKKIKKTKKFNIKYVVILGLLIIGGFLLFSSLNQTARIARIDIAQPEICKSNIESFEAANICSSTGFSSYTYACKNMPSVQIAKTSECMSYEMAYNKVSMECGQICNVVAQSPVATAMSSARPSMTPTPNPTKTPTPNPSPSTSIISCAKQLGSWTYREMCSKANSSYRYLDYKCQGDTQTRTIGGANTCKTTSALISEAKKACLNTACVTPTPTPRPTVRPTSTPTPKKCVKVGGRQICWPTRK